jgi:hypothetical protein
VDCQRYYTIIFIGSTMKQLWRVWAKALGPKGSENNLEADQIALVRTGILLLYVITNIFIIAGVIHHW